MAELSSFEPQVERFYIHADSFRELARTDTTTAFDVSMALASMRATRIASHHIEQGVDLGVFGESEASVIMAWHIEQRELAMGGLLKSCDYVPNIPYRPGLVRRVMDGRQSIHRTCFADDYYTIATTPTAAVRMDADKERIPDLVRRLSTGSIPDDLSDLVVIRGDTLVSLGNLTTEEGQLRKYRRPKALSVEKVCRVDKECRAEYDEQIREQFYKWWLYYSLLKDTVEQGDGVGADMIANAAGATRRQLERRSISCRQPQPVG